jgi:glucose/arabinose dehydrogenase
VNRTHRRRRVAAGAVVAATALGISIFATTLRPDFIEEPFVSGLTNPTAMAFAPDGRLFVCQQAGQLRVIENGVLLPTPFLTVTVSSSGERGLLGVAFDPDFETNNFVYVYYTATTPTIHNRVSRFTANGNVAAAGETILLELNTSARPIEKRGGDIRTLAVLVPSKAS